MTTKSVVVWQIHDGKPGHWNQLRGLTNALTKLAAVELHEVRAPSRGSSLVALCSKKFLPAEQLPKPDLILGAGHATHFAVLAARRAFGGKAIVLMRPSLPTALFDLCIVPEHDGVTQTPTVLPTCGVLNVVRPATAHDEQAGLMLIGGPSSAHGWSDECIVEQIASIAASSPQVNWHLTTSRRTPKSFLKLLNNRSMSNVEAVPHQKTTPTWVPEQLAKSSQVWVSEDSVSMVYEALTSGAAVGLLEVPSTKRGRVALGVESLAAQGWVTRFSEWQPHTRLASAPEQLNEARRCAEYIVSRFVQQAAA